MILNKNSKLKANVLQRHSENKADIYKGLQTPLITAINRCDNKHELVAEMLKENGLENTIEVRDDKTFKVYTMKGERVLSYLDAFLNGKKVIKYIRRQDNATS